MLSDKSKIINGKTITTKKRSAKWLRTYSRYNQLKNDDMIIPMLVIIIIHKYFLKDAKPIPTKKVIKQY